MENQAIKRKLEGQVVSNKMDKTAVVLVATVKIHPKYKKRYKSAKKYKAHDEHNKCQVGDIVVIEACRPISRDKRWRVIARTPAKIGSSAFSE